MIPVVVCDVTDEMALMKEEIFGPILPIVAVGSHGEAIRYVNARPRPLALYVFDRDRGRVDQTLRTTHTGTAAVNDCMTQFGEEHLPFGGIGPSGMGVLHGRDGFDRLSHHKGVLRQPRWNLQFLRSPPYGRTLDRLIDWFIG